VADGRRHRRILATARLVHEDENPHDDQAVRVDANGWPVAYLTRASAHIYRRWLAGQRHAGRTATCSAVIVGGRADLWGLHSKDTALPTKHTDRLGENSRRVMLRETDPPGGPQ